MSKAALLGVEEASDKKGKPYYKFELLTTTGVVPMSLSCPRCCCCWSLEYGVEHMRQLWTHFCQLEVR